VAHPRWCVPECCGFVVPPVMGEMLPRHRGTALRIGDRRLGGHVVSYLSGADGHEPVVAVYASSPLRGAGSAALPLADAWRLARRVDELLTLADHPAETGDGR
jgi:hypothetical protein